MWTLCVVTFLTPLSHAKLSIAIKTLKKKKISLLAKCQTEQCHRL